MTELADLTTATPKPPSRFLIRLALIGAGCVLVAVGLVGIFVPLLPSTVFFLGAAACFGRSSPAAYRWLTTNRVFGSRLRDYQELRGATVATKVVSLLTLWVGLAVASLLVGWRPWVDLFLFAVGLGVTAHLLSLRTLRHRN